MNTISGVIVDFSSEEHFEEYDFSDVMSMYGEYSEFDDMFLSTSFFAPTHDWEDACAEIEYAAMRFVDENYFTKNRSRIEKGIGAMKIKFWMIVPAKYIDNV